MPYFQEKAGAEHLPFPDGAFDAVVLSEVIGYTDLDRALAEAYRVLKPGGAIHITTYDPRANITDENYQLFDIEAILTAMKNIGFLQSTASGVYYDYFYLQGVKPAASLAPAGDNNIASAQEGAQSDTIALQQI